jgi:hypothetical protein
MKAVKIISGLILIAVMAWLFVSHQQTIRAGVNERDSIAYWAAGNLLRSHQNPYSASAVLSLQRAHGYNLEKPLVLRTPPWSLWMVLFLGLLDPFWAWIAWVAILLASLLIAMRVTWRMYSSEERPSAAFLVTGYLFAPIPACLVAGQLGIALLLGVILFLALEDRRPFLAGMALLIPFAKPHLFSLLWFVLAVWTLSRKKWRILGGFATAVSLAIMIALLFDPAIFAQYREMVRTAAIQYEFIPALSGVVRLIFFRRFFCVQFLPMAAAVGWSLHFYRRNRFTWNWRYHGPALLVISVLTAPYAWITDEAILLPAILQGVIWVYAAKDKLKLRSQLIIFVFASLNGLLLLLLRAKIPFATGIYFWSSLLWASWYWYAKSFQSLTAGSGIYAEDLATGFSRDRSNDREK